MNNDFNKNNYSNNLKRNKVLFYILVVLVLTIFGSIGYAYFSSSVSNTNNEKINAHAATLALTFEDNDNGVSGNLSLGQSITKRFTIENTGTVDTYAKINWYNLVNTYTANSLTWTLEQSTSENGTYTSVGSGKVPTSSAGTTKQLKNGILVPVNTTYYYKLTITLNNLDVNQNSDINANFHSFFSLEEGSLSASDKLMQLVGNADPSSTDVITREVPANANCTNTLAYDGTADNNLRYVGSNPCNYVTFNGETAGWRIVGIMNNVDDGTGVTETRIKLVRKNSLGSYSWDSSASGVNSGYGINDWSQADLKNELNGDYLNTNLNANTMWYNGQNNAQTGVFDYTKRLSAGAQELIGDAKWKLGGFQINNANLITNTMYTLERGTETYSTSHTCNDGACPRATSWTGKVALIYPSDYGYATAGGTTTTRSDCIGTVTTFSWKDSSYSDCKNNDWLKPSSGSNWLLSPDSTSYAYCAFYVHYSGSVLYTNTNGGIAILPAVYLQSGVTISSGSGTETDPYQLSL